MLKRNKIILACIVSVALLIGGVYGVAKVLTHRVNLFVLDLASTLSEEIGHPVTIADVHTNWDWFLLKINIQDLTILDSSTHVI